MPGQHTGVSGQAGLCRVCDGPADQQHCGEEAKLFSSILKCLWDLCVYLEYTFFLISDGVYPPRVVLKL